VISHPPAAVTAFRVEGLNAATAQVAGSRKAGVSTVTGRSPVSSWIVNQFESALAGDTAHVPPLYPGEMPHSGPAFGLAQRPPAGLWLSGHISTQSRRTTDECSIN
jgi:hypothetical protein